MTMMEMITFVQRDILFLNTDWTRADTGDSSFSSGKETNVAE